MQAVADSLSLTLKLSKSMRAVLEFIRAYARASWNGVTREANATSPWSAVIEQNQHGS